MYHDLVQYCGYPFPRSVPLSIGVLYCLAPFTGTKLYVYNRCRCFYNHASPFTISFSTIKYDNFHPLSTVSHHFPPFPTVSHRFPPFPTVSHRFPKFPHRLSPFPTVAHLFPPFSHRFPHRFLTVSLSVPPASWRARTASGCSDLPANATSVQRSSRTSRTR